MPIMIDIEVARQEPEDFMVLPAESLQPPANYKKAETIAEWRAEKAAGQVAELRQASCLEPLIGGTVVAVGWARDDQPAQAMLAASCDEAGELGVLKTLERALIKYPSHPLVAWCGAHYDFPWLAKRALRHGLFTLARRCYVSKPWGSPHHIDAFKVWQCSDPQSKGKLTQVARFLGLEVVDDLTGAEVPEAFARGEIERVKAKVLQDVGLLREVYWRLRAAGWILGDDAIPDLPVRPPRTSVRDELMREAAELQVATEKSRARAAAEAAGLTWEGEPPYEDGPRIDETTSADQIRAFVQALKAA